VKLIVKGSRRNVTTMAVCLVKPAHAADQQSEESERFAITFYDHVASAHQGRPERYGARPLRSTQPESRCLKSKD
jgi:hypothetical protein